MAETATVTATKAVNDKPLTAKELKTLLQESKEAENDEDCLMCGS
jgi:ribonucleoside-diphosphate reductase alpha chain